MLLDCQTHSGIARAEKCASPAYCGIRRPELLTPLQPTTQVYPPLAQGAGSSTDSTAVLVPTPASYPPPGGNRQDDPRPVGTRPGRSRSPPSIGKAPPWRFQERSWPVEAPERPEPKALPLEPHATPIGSTAMPLDTEALPKAPPAQPAGIPHREPPPHMFARMCHQIGIHHL